MVNLLKMFYMTKKIKSYLVSRANAIVFFALFALSCSSTLYASGAYVSELSSGKYSNRSNDQTKDEGDVEIVCFGSAQTYDDAVKQALRSGIEQTYGTFVSSNTTLLNDKLVADEIVSVASGNVKEFEVISKVQTNGVWNVTVKAIISTGKLISYVKSKGGSVEFAGATFAMNVKMEKLNEEAKKKVLDNLVRQMDEMLRYSFDYKIEMEDPTDNRGQLKYYEVPITIYVYANEIFFKCKKMYYNVLYALGFSKESIDEYGGHIMNLSNGRNSMPDYGAPFFFYEIGNKVLHNGGDFKQLLDKRIKRSLFPEFYTRRFFITDGIDKYYPFFEVDYDYGWKNYKQSLYLSNVPSFDKTFKSREQLTGENCYNHSIHSTMDPLQNPDCRDPRTIFFNRNKMLFMYCGFKCCKSEEPVAVYKTSLIYPDLETISKIQSIQIQPLPKDTKINYICEMSY